MTEPQKIVNVGVFLAAGRGQRLRPITDTLPKPLVKINNKSLLEQNMLDIWEFCDFFVVVISWLGEKIIKQIGESFEGKKVIYVWQANPKGGTLDALRTASVEIAKNNSNYNCIVCNSDELRGKEFYDKLANHMTLNPDKSALAVKKELDQTKLSQFGVVLKDSSGFFEKIVEKPQTFVSDLINIGLYYFPFSALTKIPKHKIAKTKEEYLPDLLNLSKEEGVFLLESEDFYRTITSPKDLETV
jgi:NDP-sugar pyrophosphorylase family protein